MFSHLRRLVGAIRVTEAGDLIRIDGLPADVINNGIKAYWETKKIGTFMFNTMTNDSLSFHSFFAPDFAYVVTTLINNHVPKTNIRALKKVLKELYLHTWLKQTQIEHQSILDFNRLHDLNLELREHQMTFLKTYNELVPKYNLHGYLLGAAPGTGKTVMGCALAACLNADIVIGIVPKNAVHEVWVKTIVEKFVKKQKYWDSLSGEELGRGYKFYFFHFEQTDRATEFFRANRPNKPVILLDESHNLNEIDSQRTQAFILLCMVTNCRHVIWSSGTLMKAIGNEAMPMFRTIDPFFTKDAETRFRQIYGKSANRAVDILRNRLGLVSYKVNKSDIMDTKPIKHNKFVVIPNGNDYTLKSVKEIMREFIKKQLAYYEKNMRSFVKRYEWFIDQYEKTLKNSDQKDEFKKYKKYIKIIRSGYDAVTMKDQVNYCNRYELHNIIPTLTSGDLKKEFKNVRSIVKYYHLKVQGEALGRVLGRLRVQCNVDMVKYSAVEEIIDHALKKTILFTSYVEVVDELHRYLTEKGYRPLRVYGETNNDLSNIVHDFDKNEDANPVIATYKSLSSAVPLTMANTLGLMNAPFRSYEEEQAISRCDRMGQDSQVYVFSFLLDTGEEPNISTRANDILDWSREQVRAILGDKVSIPDNIALEQFNDFVTGEKLDDLVWMSQFNEPNWLKW